VNKAIFFFQAVSPPCIVLPMQASETLLFLNETEIPAQPVEEAVRAVFEHLNTSTECFFIANYSSGFFQGIQVEEVGYQVEYADFDTETGDSHQFASRDILSVDQLGRMLLDLLSGGTAWRELAEWDPLDLSIDEDQEILLGSFEQREVHTLMEALQAENIDVRMEHSARGYDLIITARDMDTANTVVQRTLRLEV
jgi:hypothetical protein